MRSTYTFAPLLLTVVLSCGGPTDTPRPTTTSTTPTPSTPGADPAASAANSAEQARLLAEADQHYLVALEREAAGRYVEARAEVELAIAGGAGRDAKLLAAKLAILRDDLDAAARLLEPLAAADGNDALVLYNLGLIAQRRGEYNNARSRYLAVVKADPTYAPARYNLALLTWDAGARDEALHHATKFLELAPGDPRAPELRKQLGLDGAPAPAGPGTPTPAGSDPRENKPAGNPPAPTTPAPAGSPAGR